MQAKYSMFDQRCFERWSNGQRFCLTSKFQMFDKQCLIIWPPFQHCLSNISFVFDQLQQLAQQLVTFLSNKALVLAQ